MFVKVTKSGPRRYVKLVESFRDEAGKSRQRVIATLGRLEAVTAGESSALINGLLRVMVFNRLCDTESKLGVLPWLEDVLVPDVDTASIRHRHLLRTMDTLSDCSEVLNDVLAQQLKPLIDHELSIVFYDLTTIRAEGGTSLEDDVRHCGS